MCLKKSFFWGSYEADFETREKMIVSTTEKKKKENEGECPRKTRRLRDG